MPINDSTPRYWLRDSNGDIVASIYAKSDGRLAIQEDSSNHEATLEDDGEWRTVSLGANHAWLGQQGDAPTDSEIGSGNTALYAKGDGNIYKKPHGGSETQVGGGSSGVDVEDDGTVVVSNSTAINAGTNLSVTDDGDGTVTMDASGGSSTFDNTDPVIGPFYPQASYEFAIGGDRNMNSTPTIMPTDTSKIVLAFRSADQHGTDTSSEIRGRDSYDRLKHLTNERIIYEESGVDALAMAGNQMDSGRIGMIAGREDNSSKLAPVFIYSDDGGVTWNSTILSSLPDIWNMGEFIRYPSSVGGADNGGWIVFGSDPTQSTLNYISTTDNGANWTSVTISTTDYLIEPSVARIGTQDKWVMICRNQGGVANASALTSTNLTSWSSQQDTGQEMRENFPHLVYYNGHLWWMTQSRLYTEEDAGSTNKEISDYGNALLHQSADAETIFNDVTAWSGWSILGEGLAGNQGYGDIKEVDGYWLGAQSMGENWDDDSVIMTIRRSDTSQPERNTADYHIKDGFGDNPANLYSRRSALQSIYPTLYDNLCVAKYRPSWAVLSGSPSFGGSLSLPAGDTTAQTLTTPMEMLRVELETAFQFNSVPSTNSAQFWVQTDNPDDVFSSNGYYVNIGTSASDNLLLNRRDPDGTITTVVTGSWPLDTNEHTLRVTRSPGGEWELFVDESSQGTGTDTTHDTPNLVVQNNADASVSVPYLIVR